MQLKPLSRPLAEPGGAQAHHLHDIGLELTGVTRRRPHQQASCRQLLFDLGQAAYDLARSPARRARSEHTHLCARKIRSEQNKIGKVNLSPLYAILCPSREI